MRRLLLPLLALVALTVPTVRGTTAATAETTVADSAGSGYWMLGLDGTVHAFGDAVLLGNPANALGSADAVDLEPGLGGDGYWLLDRRGRVHAYGAAGDFGELAATDLVGTEQAVSLSATPSGEGYWIFTTRGRALAFGDAVHHGDMAGTALNGPVLDSIPTPSGKGYYMVASDGGIFSFGDAKFYGSMGDTKLNAPVQSLVPDGDGVGYWLVASDGGVFSFEASFKGSMGAIPLNKPVTGMVRFGDGYLMVGEDGGIFNFSDQPFFGSLGDRPPAHPIVAVAAFQTPSTEKAANPSPAPTHPGEPGASTTTTTTSPPANSDETVLPANLPTEEPDKIIPCETSDESAQVWLKLTPDTPWAAYNPCDRALIISWNDNASGPSGSRGAVVGPGAHFHEPEGPVDDYWSAYLDYEMEQCWPEGPLPIMLAGADDWVMPSCDDEEEDPVYDGPLCFGREPDFVGTEGDDTWGNVDDDFNDDGVVTIVGLGGNDSWSSGTIDSGTFTETYFCGGDGDDRGTGWLLGFDGGDGEDTFTPTECGEPPTLKDVEVVNPATPCPEGTP